MNKHALYATCQTRSGAELTFRIGQPTDWDTAIARWYRVDNRRGGYGVPARPCVVRWMRRRYVVQHFEVRAVDYNGRGLGSERHSLAFPVPFRTLTTAR